jgi:chromosome segregation ATPase
MPVQFHGAYRPPDLEALELDIAVLPSIASESYSFALDEAFRLGLPALVPDRGALVERIGAAGLTFRAGEADDLARRLQEILDRPRLLETMRRNIRVDTLFSMEAHVAMIEKAYEEAIQSKVPEQSSFTPYAKLVAQAKQQIRDRDAMLAEFPQRLAQAEQSLQEKEAQLRQAEQGLREKEALLQHAILEREERLRHAEEEIRLVGERLKETAERLKEAEQAIREKDSLIQETQRTLDILRGDHANLRSYILELRRTPLFKLQEILAKLSRSP